MAEQIESSQTHPEKVRRTVTFTHKQLGMSATILTALLAIPQLNTIKEFFTGENTSAIARIDKTLDEKFDKLERTFAAHAEGELESRRRLRDQTWAEIASTERRCEKRTDDLLTRIVTLERARRGS